MSARRSMAKSKHATERAVLKALDAKSPNEVRRALVSALRTVAAPEYGSAVGQLFLAGKVDAAEHTAAKKWAELCERYSKVTGAPRVTNAALERRVHTNGHAVLPPGADHHDRAIVTAMSEAAAALASAGPTAAAVTRRVVEQDAWLRSVDEHTRLHAGLSALAQHWRLTR